MRKLLLLLLILIAIPSVAAVGISPGSKVYETENYSLSEQYEILLINHANTNEPVILTIDDDSLAQYVHLSDYEVIVPPASTKRITVTVNVPETSELVGRQTTRIRATQGEADGGGLIQVRTAVISRLEVYFPYPGQFLEITRFGVGNINEGENSLLEVEIRSRGDEPVNFEKHLSLREGEEEIMSMNYDNLFVGGRSTYTFTETLDTSGLPPGEYAASLRVLYDDKEISRDTVLRIGKEGLALDVFHPIELRSDAVNSVTIAVRNLWNRPATNIYAELSLGDHTTTTPTVSSLRAFDTISIDHFLDTSRVGVGEHDVTIRVYFNNGNMEEFTRRVTVSDTAPVADLRRETPLGTGSNMTYIIIGIMGFLLLVSAVVITWLIARREK